MKKKIEHILNQLTMVIHNDDKKKGLNVYGRGHLDTILNTPFVKYEYQTDGGNHYLILHPYMSGDNGATPARTPDSFKDTKKGRYINHINGETADALIANGYFNKQYTTLSFMVDEYKTEYGILRNIIVDLDNPTKIMDEGKKETRQDIKQDAETVDVPDDKQTSERELLIKIDKKLDAIRDDVSVLRGWLNA